MGLALLRRPLGEGSAQTQWLFQGERGGFAVLEGEIQAPVLQWLREGFLEYASRQQSSWSFGESQPGDRRVENARKLEIYGQLEAAGKQRLQLFGFFTGAPPF